MIGAHSLRTDTPYGGWTTAMLASLAVFGLALVFGLRSADPRTAEPARWAALRSEVRTQAGVADSALHDLEERLQIVVDAARRGAAATANGEAAADSQLLDAAEQLDAAADSAAAARREVARLGGLLATVAPDEPVPSLEVDAAELRAIAAQLRGAAPAATEFAERRRAAEETIEHLGEAIAALDAGRLASARRAADEAERQLDVVRAWDGGPATLPVWTDTTAQLLVALRELAAAVERGDEAAIADATAQYEEAAAAAHQADIALNVALAEGGAAVTASPLQRLADVMRSVAGTRAAVASVLHR